MSKLVIVEHFYKRLQHQRSIILFIPFFYSFFWGELLHYQNRYIVPKIREMFRIL